MLAFLEPWAERRICFAAFGAHQDFPAAHMNMSSISKFRGKQGYVGPKTGLSFCAVSRLLRTDKVTSCCPFAPKIQAGTESENGRRRAPNSFGTLFKSNLRGRRRIRLRWATRN